MIFDREPIFNQPIIEYINFGRESTVNSTSSGLNYRSGIFSTLSSTRVVMYSEITEYNTGVLVNLIDKIQGLLPESGNTIANPPSSIYTPFDDAAGYALARWFFLEKYSKGVINRFF
jgi:hypothetical protein